MSDRAPRFITDSAASLRKKPVPAMILTLILLLQCFVTSTAMADATLTVASGGAAISASTVGGAWTTLTGPIVSEGITGDIDTGTLTLSAPAGFEFDITGTAPTVLITRIFGTGGSARNINGASSGTAAAIASISASAISFSVTSATSNSVRNSLTFQNIRVRPTASTPLGSFNITKSGDCAIASIVTTDWGVLTLVDQNPVPVASSLSSASKLVGDATFTQTITGSNFINTSVVRVDGVDQTTTFISGTQLSISIAASSMTVAATKSITVFNPTPGGGTSAALDFVISISTTGATLTVATGGEAISSSTVGGAWTTLTGPSVSEGVTGDIDTGTLTLSAPPGFEFDTTGTAPTVSITRIFGTGGDARNINDVASGTAVAIASISASAISFSVTAATSNSVRNSLTFQNIRVRPTASTPLGSFDITKSGTCAITSIGTTNWGVLTLVTPNPEPVANSLSSPTKAVGDATFTQTITGSNFINTSVVRIDGVDQTTTFISSTQLSISIAASSMTIAGTKSITVFNPTPGGGTSAALTFTISGSGPDHVRLEYAAAALTCGGGITPIGVRACADAACTSLYSGSVTVNLSTSSGALSSSSVIFSNGLTSVNLTKTTAGSVTLAGAVTAPTSSTATCFTGVAESACVSTPITYTARTDCFGATETGQAPGTNLLTKLVSTPFNLDVVAVTGGAVDTASTKQFWVSLVNPAASTGNCTDSATGLTNETSHTFVGGDLGRKSFPLTLLDTSNAIKNIKVRIRDTSGSTCSADDFSIRPYALSVTTTPTSATGTASAGATFKAGTDTFTVTARPVNASNATVTGYDGLPKVDTTKLTGSDILGTLAPLVFNTTATGTFTYNQVGTLTFGNFSLYDDTWVGNDIANGDCTLDFSNSPVSGKYGCKIGNTSDLTGNTFAAGRFLPDHFRTVITQGTVSTDARIMTCSAETALLPCPSGFFAYAGQPFNRTVTAYLPDGTVASNYAGLFSKDVTLSAVSAAGSAVASSGGTLTNTTILATDFSAGVSSSAGSRATSSFTFTTPLTTPANVFLRAIDTESISSLRSPSTSSVEGGLKIVSGRVRVQNSYGSELLDLPVPMRVEYWKSSTQGWAGNGDDKITDVAFPVPTSLNGTVSTCARGTSGDAISCGAAALPIASRAYVEAAQLNDAGLGLKAGEFNLWLKAPGTSGTVLLAPVVPVWLRYNWTGTSAANPTAIASFGVRKPTKIISRQEMVR